MKQFVEMNTFLRGNSDKAPDLVSIHGGHSQEFCSHAKDSLEQIIKVYIEKKFKWVGITEHMPPVDDNFLYPEEIDKGLNAQKMYERFSNYISTCRNLQKKYKSFINIFVGFETETCTNSKSFIFSLINQFQPDYIVGSVHHVNDIPIDYSKDLYQKAVKRSGSMERLYFDYFDQQYEMIQSLKPSVIGHFDLIRIFDPDYEAHLKIPLVAEKIQRNLKLIKDVNLVLDFNLRALCKGAKEPYISLPILKQALDLGISVVPGDDSHSVDSAGLNIEKGIMILKNLGFNTNWPCPVKSL